MDATPFITTAFKHGAAWGTLAGLIIGFRLGVIYSTWKVRKWLREQHPEQW